MARFTSARLRAVLIKTIERSPLDDFAASAFRPSRWRSGASGSIETAAAAPGPQSTKLTDAVDHASGVYFPNRAHQVCIHTKRLRYLVELASTTTRPRDDRELTALKRVQSVLGDLHDRELLLKRLDEEVHRARKSTRFVSE